MNGISIWLQSSLRRVYPTTPAGQTSTIDLLAVRGERISFQACAHNKTTEAIAVKANADGPNTISIQVRRVGYVPMQHFNTDTPTEELEGIGHVPGLVPDPLMPETEATLGPFETAAFWITLTVKESCAPSCCELTVSLTSNGQTGQLKAKLLVSPVTLPPTHPFPVTHWFYADALCDFYKVEPFNERFWQLLRPYMRNMVDHGNACMYVPLFTPPTDGVKRPHQLLRIGEPEPGRYVFDFSDVRRWARMALECGAKYFEWTHLFSQWGVQNPLRIYRDNANPDSLLWPPETGATSDVYRRFLSQFLPAFHTFLGEECLLDCSYFHLSDEPHADHLPAYRAAREMLCELAPWMKVSDALSDLAFGKEGLTDIPIPSIGTAREYVEAGIRSWAYFCCGPRGKFLNRLMDTPLAKIRMSGWLLHRFKAEGFLHWGYNYWYRSQTRKMINPFQEQSGETWPGWAYGDPFVVYPGPDGPIDSIRWEVWAESMQDLRILKALDIDPEDPLLAELVGYDEFPKSEEWITAARQALLTTED